MPPLHPSRSLFGAQAWPCCWRTSCCTRCTRAGANPNPNPNPNLTLTLTLTRTRTRIRTRSLSLFLALSGKDAWRDAPGGYAASAVASATRQLAAAREAGDAEELTQLLRTMMMRNHLQVDRPTNPNPNPNPSYPNPTGRPARATHTHTPRAWLG